MSLKKVAKKLYRSLPISIQCRLDSFRQGGVLTRDPSSFVHPSVHILGKAYVKIGPNSCISEDTWLNVNHRDGASSRIVIGANCFIGKRNFFTSGEVIKVGDFCLTAVDAKFLGSSHLIDDPTIPYLFSGTTRDKKIVLGANCFIGAGASIVGDVTIGHGCVVGAGALVSKSLPPFSLALGAPAEIIKRYSFRLLQWVKTDQFTDEDEAAIPAEDAYVKELHLRFSTATMPYIACGKSMGDL